MNWLALILFGIAIIALIIFLVVRNQKDKKALEEQLKNDYHKFKGKKGDEEVEQVMK